jgi:geranylgeranyl diphosphate synthase type II
MDPSKRGSGALDEILREVRGLVDEALDRYLPGGAPTPPVLAESMRYSVFAGGKRIRPVLVLLGCRACGGQDADALPAAAAVEMIHTYSLIHDDLPAMDDDELRRGQPTNHVRFGEAVAILAGDALLTHAFEVIATGTPRKERVPRIIEVLARAAGPEGMVGGQVLDLAAEGQKQDTDLLNSIHALKTAALLGASARIGGEAAGADPRVSRALEEYGVRLGLAFQAIDDVLDEEGSAETLGKTAGKDRRSAKVTSASLYGLEGARSRALEYSRKAREHAESIPGGEILAALSDRLLGRKF